MANSAAFTIVIFKQPPCHVAYFSLLDAYDDTLEMPYRRHRAILLVIRAHQHFVYSTAALIDASCWLH